MAKNAEKEIVEKTTDNVINTMDSINKPASDAKLQKDALDKAKSIAKAPRKEFKCSSIYASLYPEGMVTTYQGVIINLIFDNRVLNLPEPVIEYIEERIQRKADREAKKQYQFDNKIQEHIGDFTAGE